MAATTEPSPAPRRFTLRPDQVWPAIIITTLAVVMLVNACFIWVAVRGADEVAPSYAQGER